MATEQLVATPRTTSGKGAARSLRRDGQFPAVIYGHSREAQPLSVNSREFSRLLERAGSENTVIELSVDGRSSHTLIREIQRHPVKRNVLHVDFQELVAGEQVIVHIPIVLQGIPAGVRLSGGILNQVMQELECRVDPLNMPGHIDVDVTNVTIGHSLHVSDIVIPPGVEVLEDAESTVAVVAAPKAEVTPTEDVEVVEGPAEPELIRKPKDEGEEEGEEG
jgi:large subunit ribosomal protein L25